MKRRESRGNIRWTSMENLSSTKLDDDVKISVVLRECPQKLRDHLVVSPRAVARACYGVHVWLHRDMVQCVSSRLLSCPVYVVFVSGALRWVLQGRSHSLPPDELPYAVAHLGGRSGRRWTFGRRRLRNRACGDSCHTVRAHSVRARV